MTSLFSPNIKELMTPKNIKKYKQKPCIRSPTFRNPPVKVLMHFSRIFPADVHTITKCDPIVQFSEACFST